MNLQNEVFPWKVMDTNTDYYYPDSLYICQHSVSFFIKESMGMFGKYEMVIMM